MSSAPARASAATTRTSRSASAGRSTSPSRYVFGYISDVGVPAPVEPMDFAAWFEAYLDGEWHTFDPRNNKPRTGRVIVGRGRDAADCALITSFGALELTRFEVIATERAS